MLEESLKMVLRIEYLSTDVKNVVSTQSDVQMLNVRFGFPFLLLAF